MRHVVVSSVALVALLTSLPAHAELDVTLGGEVSFQAAMFDTDRTDSSDRDFASTSDMFIRASGTAENGMEYGALVSLLTSTSDTNNSKRTYVYAQGGWGRVELGDNDGASELGLYAPTVGVGQIDGALNDFIFFSDRADTQGDLGDANFKPLDSFRATKATYYTPVIAGFQAGASYAPEWDSSATGESVQFLTDAGQASNIVELALRYQDDIGPVNLGVSGQYNFGEGADMGGGLISNNLSAWGLGMTAAYKGFTVGGGYTHDGNSLNSRTQVNDDVSSWNIGATYEQGAWGVGISYLAYDLDQNGSVTGSLPSDGSSGKFTLTALGATYAVAPGLAVGADLGFYDRDRDAPAVDTNGWVLVTEVRASF